jgi:hypothetical protein
MFRKTMLALTALGALSAAALAPTSASAGWKHHGWHGHFGGVRIYTGPVGYVGGYDSCYRKRVVYTKYGPVVKLVNVCAW